jgi:hypothetical protein
MIGVSTPRVGSLVAVRYHTTTKIQPRAPNQERWKARDNMAMNNETRAVVNRMFTEDELSIHPWDDGAVDMQRVADALMVENVRVKKLTLCCLVDIEDAEALRDALQVNHTLNELAFEILSVHCFVAIAAGMSVTQNIKSLELNRLRRGNHDFLVSFNTALLSIMSFVEELSFDECPVGDAGARILADALRNSTCQSLKLNSCSIGSEGTAHIGQALGTNTTLRTLNLKWNNFGDIGAVALARGLMGNQSIRVLNLENCDIGTSGAAAVGRLLVANTTVEELDKKNLVEPGALLWLMDCPGATVFESSIYEAAKLAVRVQSESASHSRETVI